LKRSLVYASMLSLAGCSSANPSPLFPAGPPSIQAPTARHQRAIANVYVVTTQFGLGRHASGKDQILRFPAGQDTSKPNMTVDLAESPAIGPAVNPKNGRIAFALTDGQIQVRNKDLAELYTFSPHFDGYGFPISIAYDHANNLWVGGWLGTDFGELHEYYGNDTKPDNIYHIPTPSADNPPYSIAFDGGDTLFVEGLQYVWAACNTGGGCSNTSIPSYSEFLDEYYSYIAPMATLGGGSRPLQIVAATPKRYIKYFAPSGTRNRRKWHYTGRSHRCSGQYGMFIADLTSDPRDTLYLTCEVLGAGTSRGSANGASTIVELSPDGHKKIISGLTNPDGAGAF
jgi:hypothetical protein